MRASRPGRTATCTASGRAETPSPSKTGLAEAAPAKGAGPFRASVGNENALRIEEDASSMKQPFKAVKVSDHVYWVGAIDWSLRDFHGYSTERGTTYNAYLILADKITLVDAVKAPFKDELLARIGSVINPEQISYIVSNHAEMDHSGCLPQIVETVKPEQIFASTMGVKNLSEQLHIGQEITAVKDGESLSLGNMSLSFVETKMLHWPDSMFSYLDADELLFSNDAFGMHLASSGRFDVEVPDWEYQAAKYYANILMPFSHLVLKLLDRMGSLNLPIKTIAPDHGPIWRRDIDKILKLYATWAQQKPTRKAVIAYDTMWESTALMARAIGDGLVAGGTQFKLMPLKVSHRSDVVTELLDAGALLVGSSTMNNNMLPAVADLLTYLKGLRPKNLIGTAFGSYGWSGESVGHVREVLSQIGVELVGDGVKAKFVPTEEVLTNCFNLGIQTAERLKNL